MALIIRMRQQGAKGRQAFRLVVTDSKTPRDGKYLEMVGWYNPFAKEGKTALVKIDRVQHWLDYGVQMSDKAKALVKRYHPDVIQKLNQKRVLKTAKRREKRKKEVDGD